MKYFKEIPNIAYPNLEADDNTYVVLKNLMTRSAFLQDIVENTGVFYEYEVKEDETPEIIAHKLYGSVERFWIVLLFNKLMNPFYDFPLNSTQLNSLFESKYGYDAETAQTTLHHYERWVSRAVQLNGVTQTTELDKYVISAYEQDPDTGLATLNPYLPGIGSRTVYESTTEAIDDNYSIATVYSIKSVTVYDYEFDLNEAKRSIKLLDPKYAGRVEAEFKRLMNE